VYKKILIINPFGIGDVLFTTPIIHTLKDTFPGVKIGYLCNRRTKAILESNPYVDWVFVYERDEFEEIKKSSFFGWLKKLSSFLREIKNEHFELAIDFSLNTQYGFFSWFAGIKKRIGYDFKKRGRFLTQKVNLTGYSNKHIVEYYADLLKYLGLELKYRNLELYLNAQDKKWIEEILAQENLDKSSFLVGIIPGAGRSWGKDSSLKHWRAENFAKLADKIVENYKAQIIIMGDFFEQELAHRVKMSMHYKAIDLSGRTNIGQLAALLSITRLVITNDGGPLHMAVALGRKTVSFFGPVDPKVYGPYPLDTKRHIVLESSLDCSPCYHNFRLSGCKHNKECLEKIDVKLALNAVSTLLSESGG